MATEFRIGHGDAVAWLRTLPSASVDLMITDPPYESLEKHRKIGTTTRLKHSKASSNDWFEIMPNSRFPELFAEVYRVLRPNRHFYLFCDQETMFVAKPLAEAAGFKFWKPLVWDKKKIGMGYHYRARYEFILFFEKGKRKLSNLGTADVIEASGSTTDTRPRSRLRSARSWCSRVHRPARSSATRSWDQDPWAWPRCATDADSGETTCAPKRPRQVACV